MLLDGLDPQPFGAPAAACLPPGWLAAIPGRTVFAAHARLMQAGAELPDPGLLGEHFGSHFVLGSEVADGAGYAFTDFRIHADGFCALPGLRPPVSRRGRPAARCSGCSRSRPTG